MNSGNIFNGEGIIDAGLVLGKSIDVVFSKGLWKIDDNNDLLEQLIVSSEDDRTGFSGWTGYLGLGEFIASVDGVPAICTIEVF